MAEDNENGNTNVIAVDRNKVVFRCNISACMDLTGNTSFQIVMRLIPSKPPKYSDIGVELEYLLKCIPRIGIVYMAGETGSGKSTTLSSFIRYILEEDTHIQGNIITIEEPIGVPLQRDPVDIRLFLKAKYQSIFLLLHSLLKRSHETK